MQVVLYSWSKIFHQILKADGNDLQQYMTAGLKSVKKCTRLDEI
jgi:hypothetical protein